MNNKRKNVSGFSIIEILVGIFIFSMGLTSIYAIIVSTMKLNDYNKNYIIATNLAREQLELIRNYRDVNYKKTQKYNQINPANLAYDNVFSSGKYYKIENNYSSSASFPISLDEVIDLGDISSFQLCLTSNNSYTYDCSVDNTKTIFYRYFYIDDVEYSDSGTTKKIDSALKIKSKVIWQHRGKHEFEVNMILADFNRL